MCSVVRSYRPAGSRQNRGSAHGIDHRFWLGTNEYLPIPVSRIDLVLLLLEEDNQRARNHGEPEPGLLLLHRLHLEVTAAKAVPGSIHVPPGESFKHHSLKLLVGATPQSNLLEVLFEDAEAQLNGREVRAARNATARVRSPAPHSEGLHADTCCFTCIEAKTTATRRRPQ